jgi:hypothetical protein
VLHGWDGVLQLASLPLFPPNKTMVITAQNIRLLSLQTRGHFSKKYDLCPHVQLQTVVWLFCGGFGAVASSLLSGLLRLCQYRTRFTVDIDTFVPVSSSIPPAMSFVVVLGLICIFRTKVRSFLKD